MAGLFRQEHPIENGMVTNPTGFQRLCHHVITNHLGRDPAEQGLVIGVGRHYSWENQERICEVLFEGMGVPSLAAVPQPVLCACSAAAGSVGPVEAGSVGTGPVPAVSAQVVDCGLNYTRVSFVVDGRVAPWGTEIAMGGADQTELLIRGVNRKGYGLFNAAQRQVLELAKPEICYVPRDYQQELKKVPPIEEGGELELLFEMPDGQVVPFVKERLMVGEVLFNPWITGTDQAGFPLHLGIGLEKFPIATQKRLIEKTVVAGGPSLMKGFLERLQEELRSLYGAQKDSLIAPETRKYAAWIGGSALASQSDFLASMLTIDDYDEMGPSAVRDKFSVFYHPDDMLGNLVFYD